MALPTLSDQLSFDYVLGGRPCVLGPAKSSIDTLSFDYVLGGRPFVATTYAAAGGAANPWWYYLNQQVAA